jgi:hypothetical protein
VTVKACEKEKGYLGGQGTYGAYGASIIHTDIALEDGSCAGGLILLVKKEGVGVGIKSLAVV